MTSAERAATELTAPIQAASAHTPVILIDHVWKAYRPKTHQVSLRHEAGKLVAGLLRSGSPEPDQPFWALRDVTASIHAGESIAIVGRNGSGKTTLLRILSGITHPTRGRVRVGGRFATLIGLGAGFNVERTGRENVYLNAAIQGVPPRRAKDLMDDIVAFSELEEFIDVPVKRYSSGMVTRLGFSIAAHILPDMMFIDEVLAVGDAAFQRKCLDRILEMKAQGRTLLFVSHAAETVRALCERALWLDRGQLRLDGPVDSVLEEYDAWLRSSESPL